MSFIITYASVHIFCASYAIDISRISFTTVSQSQRARLKTCSKHTFGSAMAARNASASILATYGANDSCASDGGRIECGAAMTGGIGRRRVDSISPLPSTNGQALAPPGHSVQVNGSPAHRGGSGKLRSQ